MKKLEGSGQEKKGEQEMWDSPRREEIVNGQAVTFALIDQVRFMRDTQERLSNIKDIKELPFVKDTATGEGKKKVTERSFWSVNPSGDYTKDCETGYKYAAMYHAWTQNNRNSGGALQHIVFSMIESGNAERDRGLIVGFFYFIDSYIAPYDTARILFRHEIVQKWIEIAGKNRLKRKHFLPYEWEYQGDTGKKERATA